MESDAEFENWITSKNKISFKLTEQTYYAAIIKRTDSHYVWYFNQHHIFTDAYCFQVLFNKLSKIYKAELNNEAFEIDSDTEAYIDNFKKVEGLDDESSSKPLVNKQSEFHLYGHKISNPNYTPSQRSLFTLKPELVKEIHAKLAELKLRTLSPSLDLLSFLITTIVVTISKISNQNESLQISNIFSKRFTKDSMQIARPLIEVLSKQISINQDDDFSSLYKKVYSFLILRDTNDTTLSPSLSPLIINFFDLKFIDFAGIKSSFIWRHCGHMDAHHSLRFHILRYQSTDDYQIAFDVKENNSGLQITS